MDTASAPAAEGPGPELVLAILAGHWQTKILLTATESDLFGRLSGTSATADELAESLGYHMPGCRDFLRALVGLGLLELAGDRFRNSPVADRYLVRGRPEHVGGYLRFCERELNPAWDGLATTLRTGQPHNKAAVDGNPYQALYEDQETTDSFLDSMDMFNTPVALSVSRLDWSGYHSFVDVGGARGNLAHHVVARNPHLTGVVFDLPQVRRAFTEHMAAVGASSAISFQGGDFFTDPLPEADVLIFGHVLHNWGPDERVQLIRNAYKAVRPGGAVFIYDPMVDDDTPPLNAVLASLSMQVWSAGGQEYSVEQCHAWLREAGFRPATANRAELPDDILVIGHKDG
jgi:8-O-methyltransferase